MKPPVARLHRLALKLRRLPVVMRYLATCSLVALVLWVETNYIGDGHRHTPLLPFVPIVLLCGAFLDRGNGFLATLASAGGAAYYLYPTIGELSLERVEDQLAIALFIVIGFTISFIVETLHAGLVELSVEHERARKAIADRTLLLEELSHRTRNDFANVVMLLKQQARGVSEEAREALTAAAERVLTIGRVHRRLELRGDRVVVDSRSYIEELCTDLRLSLLAGRPVSLEHHVESHKLGLEMAVPLGLIINESITNAAKHAFPGGEAGLILVSFVRSGASYRLTVSDNGVGMPSARRDGALGTNLMRMLARQLGARVETEMRDPGTAVIVVIPVKTSDGSA